MANTIFIVIASIFIFGLIEISAIVGVSALTGTVGFTPPAPPTDPLTTILYVISNIGVFFQLMTISSTFLIFGTVVIVPLTIGIFYEVLQMVRGN